MDITKGCVISGRHGFDLIGSNRFAVIEAEGKRQDLIRVNRINGIRFNELFAAYEYPYHDECPIVDDENKAIILGGAEKASKRTVFVIGK